MAGILQPHPSRGLPPGGRDDLGLGKWLCCSGRNLCCPHGLLSDSSASSSPGRDSNTVRVSSQVTCARSRAERALRAFAGLIFTTAVRGGYDEHSYIATESAVF